MMDYDAAMAELRRVCNGERAPRDGLLTLHYIPPPPPPYDPEIDLFPGRVYGSTPIVQQFIEAFRRKASEP